MSDTLKPEYKKHRPQGRANELGLCRCSQCNATRNKSRTAIKAKHKARTNWKTGGVKLLKGIYKA